jgi:hypothetical protein
MTTTRINVNREHSFCSEEQSEFMLSGSKVYMARENHKTSRPADAFCLEADHGFRVVGTIA